MAARHHAETHARDRGAPPHWLRCEWYDGTHRCRLGEDHGGAHEFEGKEDKT